MERIGPYIPKKLELFFEIAAQSGKISKDVKQSGFAFDAGAHWNFGNRGTLDGLCVDLNTSYRSGQKNKTDSTAFVKEWATRTGAILAENNACSRMRDCAFERYSSAISPKSMPSMCSILTSSTIN